MGSFCGEATQASVEEVIGHVSIRVTPKLGNYPKNCINWTGHLVYCCLHLMCCIYTSQRILSEGDKALDYIYWKLAGLESCIDVESQMNLTHMV